MDEERRQPSFVTLERPQPYGGAIARDGLEPPTSGPSSRVAAGPRLHGIISSITSRPRKPTKNMALMSGLSGR